MLEIYSGAIVVEAITVQDFELNITCHQVEWHGEEFLATERAILITNWRLVIVLILCFYG